MTRTRVPTAAGRIASGALWLARWLLVVALVFDQVGSPLHLHKHDSGVDALWSQSHGQQHAEESDSGMTVSHAVLAVRSQAERELGVSDLDRSFDVAATEAPRPAVPSLVVLLPRVDWKTLAAHGHQSLRPEGRAPPLHT